MRSPCGDQRGCTASVWRSRFFLPEATSTTHRRLSANWRSSGRVMLSSEYTIDFASGDQLGLYPPSATRWMPLPSRFITKMPPPARSDRKAIDRPSGEKAGCVSSTGALWDLSLRLTASRSPMAFAKISLWPSDLDEYTRVVPSGDRLGKRSSPESSVSCANVMPFTLARGWRDGASWNRSAAPRNPATKAAATGSKIDGRHREAGTAACGTDPDATDVAPIVSNANARSSTVWKR